MKAKAVGIGILAWFAYGIVLSFVLDFVTVSTAVRSVAATAIVVAAVATAVAWYRKRTETVGEPDPSG